MSRWIKILALPLAAVMLAGACSSDDETDATGDDTEQSGGSGGGTVNVTGSSTVAPISTRVAELWEASGVETAVNVDGPGTGDGFVLFCEGGADISDASRPIKEEEMATCEENGVEFIELKVAFDGLSVVTNPANSVECLSFADIYALVGPESQGFKTWADGQELATTLGSDTELPDAPLDITAPGEESGTYDSFVELVIEPAGEARVESGDMTEDEIAMTRPDYQSSADDNIIIQGIEGSDSSFGWVGFAFAEEAGDGVKELAVSAEPNGECVAPSGETISDGSYPISRPLFIYVDAAAAEDNSAVADYVDYYLSDDGIAAVAEVGYVELPADELDATRTVWENRETGTREG
ncbi:MAG: substrate-binding domain-containing protein [Microthrixaceae bacterium]